MSDLLALTAELVDIPSVSHDEADLVADLERRLGAAPWLEVDRVGDNVVARTQWGHPMRLVLAGHTDTVPPNGNDRARIEGDRLWGLGSADMKGGLAVMVDLATTVESAAVDVTYVFYAREEVRSDLSGLGELFEVRPDLVAGDVALLGEPTGAALEAGCQGTMRLRASVVGARAHTARAWMGDNAIHRLAELLTVLADYEGRRPVIDGCEYREGLQAVGITGGVAGNVVPDHVDIEINHRFAPDRDIAEAEAHVAAVLDGVLGSRDTLEIVDASGGASPGLDHPLLSALVERNRLEVRAKLGWTDVARFAAAGIPAANFGPGDAELAHSPEERVHRSDLEAVRSALGDLVASGVRGDAGP